MINTISIIVYFAVWAALHSFLASLRVKNWARGLFGPEIDRWYRLFFVLFATASLIPLVVLMWVLPDASIYVVPPPWRWLLVAGQAAAAIALVSTVFQSGAAQFLGLAQLTADDPSGADRLQVGGLYRYARHPLYLFSIFFMWLTPVMTRNLASLYLCMTVYFIVGSYHEEELLVHKFGQDYQDYKAQVPRFVPRPGRSFDAESA
jgi:protein-S-isoprenylcysteine O-methyltransferase Ste14